MVQFVLPPPSPSPSPSPSPNTTNSIRIGNRLNRHLQNVVILVSLVYLLVIRCESLSPEEEEREKNALLEFKSSLENGDMVLGNWNNPPRCPCPQVGSGSPRTSWTGVICNNGNVWGIQLDNMKLSGEINVDSLQQLGQLRSLSLMNNNFQGPFPEFRKLRSLKALYICTNKFSGDIDDDAFVGMSSLKKVHLAYNEFTGDIPRSLASSTSLTELRIENNQFMGPIPDFPHTLIIFNASNNHLQGPIPPFLDEITDASSFTGNDGLCGPPISSVCDETGASYNPYSSTDETHKKMSMLTVIVMIISALLAITAIATLFMLYLLGKSRIDHMRDYSEGSSFSTCTSPGGSVILTEQQLDSKKPPSIVGAQGKLTFLKEDGPRFDLNDLLRASAEVLGYGSFGSAYKAVMMDGQALVVKRFRQMSNCGKVEFHEHMRTLGRLSHPNLLPLTAYYYRKEEKLLVFNFVHNGSLQRQLHGKHTTEKLELNWPTRLKIIKGVAKGMAYLYTELPNLLVPHGNLKSSNVLVDNSMQPLLMDYTLLPVVNVEHAQNMMVAYKAPEYIKDGRISKKLDVWSLGILILETMTGKLPANSLAQGQPSKYGSELGKWVESIQGEAVEEVFDKDMKDIDNAQGQMVKLIKIGLECCEVDVEKRPEMEDVANKIQQLDERDN
ncbi:pollen receptor-like kinase 1 [Lactuca sativa]|uniref:Protein kinase domain-containing protein n=1 Tax=Lactuca sativa TaxID=4236 RepID=A0A9R1XLY8_LACSA|nr:pollen receptor-like kinase 1 [Lactuca sativa]KAJ0212372.1 hypothetical protein LSAT_V11C400198650 [Lactuca sativa]